MKKIFKFAFSLVITIILIIASPVYVFATGSVTYNGNADKFIFSPGSSYSPTDLFGDFKNVMPGDVLTDSIIIRNNIGDNQSLELWVKFNGAADMSEGSNDLYFLSQLKLKVMTGDTIIVEEPLDTTDWIYLGKYENDESTTLNLELSVPAEFIVERTEGMTDTEYNALYDKVQNSIADTAGYIEWEFKAQVYGEKTTGTAGATDTDNKINNFINTGDLSNIFNYILAMITSAFVIIFLVLFKKRKS